MNTEGQTGDASFGCGEGPAGESDEDEEQDE